METFFKALGMLVGAAVVVAIFGTLFAYPTKWVVNYLFSPGALNAVFGVARFDFWHALAFNFFAGNFRGISTSSKKN